MPHQRAIRRVLHRLNRLWRALHLSSDHCRQHTAQGRKLQTRLGNLLCLPFKLRRLRRPRAAVAIRARHHYHRSRRVYFITIQAFSKAAKLNSLRLPRARRHQSRSSHRRTSKRRCPRVSASKIRVIESCGVVAKDMEKLWSFCWRYSRQHICTGVQTSQGTHNVDYTYIIVDELSSVRRLGILPVYFAFAQYAVYDTLHAFEPSSGR